MNAVTETWVDGHLCIQSWPHDRALQYGDGLFETMVVRNGHIRFEALHGERLARGCARLQLHADQTAIWQQARQLAQRHGTALLKLLLTRGDATVRGYAPSGTETARVILSVYPAAHTSELPEQIRAVTLRNCLGENPDLAGIKHCNRLEQVLARASLRGTGAFEGLMASSSGQLISGTMSNVFVELDGVLTTPELDRCGVAGVMRAVILREAARCGVAVRMGNIPLQALDRCTGLALSNVRLGLLPVSQLDGRRLQISAAVGALKSGIDALER
jgi:4-amino-4-deoxychorismate lyase